MKLFSMMLANPGCLNTLKTAVQKILNPVLIIACLVGIIYAIWVGITFAKADSADQRKEAKNKLITVIVGIVAGGALIALFYWLAWMIDKEKIHFDFTDTQYENSEKGNNISPLGIINFAKNQLMWIRSFF